MSHQSFIPFFVLSHDFQEGAVEHHKFYIGILGVFIKEGFQVERVIQGCFSISNLPWIHTNPFILSGDAVACVIMPMGETDIFNYHVFSAVIATRF